MTAEEVGAYQLTSSVSSGWACGVMMCKYILLANDVEIGGYKAYSFLELPRARYQSFCYDDLF